MVLTINKSQAQVTAVVLILAILATSSIVLFNWTQNFSEDLQTKNIHNPRTVGKDIKVIGLEQKNGILQAILKSPISGYKQINNITLNGKKCTLLGSNVITGKSISIIPIDCPTINEVNNLVIYTKYNVIESSNSVSINNDFLNCIGPDSSIISHLGSSTYYQNSKPEFGENCISETRICNNGILSGDYNYSSCIEDIPISKNSLLFDGVDDYLNWTPSQIGNRKTWTWSGWVKLNKVGDDYYYMMDASPSGTNQHWLGINALGKAYFGHYDGTIVWNAYTQTTLFDESDWINLIYSFDSTNPIANQRAKIFVNGVSVMDSTSTYPPLNFESNFNNNVIHTTTRQYSRLNKNFNGYMTEVNFIDGEALTPNDFGKYNNYGKWVPKKYEGTYGTNGFHLTFENSSNLGQDFSGNENDWTVNNNPVQTIDIPENNFATLNPLYNLDNGVLSKGNLNWVSDNSYYSSELSSFEMNSGKWWFRSTLISSTGSPRLGIVKLDGSDRKYRLGNSQGELMYKATDGNIRYNGNNVAYGTSWNNPNDIIDTYLDLDNKEITFFVNSVSQGNYDISSWWNEEPLVFAISDATSASQIKFDIEFGATLNSPNPLFKTLSSKNLPKPTVIPSQGFEVLTYTGDGNIRDIEGLDFSPSLVWIKNRDQADSHKLFDILRGPTKYIESDTTDIETIDINSLTSFNSNGFSLGTGTNGFNDNGEKFVAWNWKEGPEYGFDIVNFTGTGTQHYLKHSLGKTPELIIAKSRQLSWAWPVWQDSFTFSDNLALNTNGAITSGTNNFAGLPNSTHINIGTSTTINQNNDNSILYLFASIEGFSKIGSYTGTGTVDGPFIYTGFKPKYILIKRTDSTGTWSAWDTQRDSINPAHDVHYVNLNSATGNTPIGNFLSNGFKVTSTNPQYNENTGNYIYIAFAEYPLSTNY